VENRDDWFVPVAVVEVFNVLSDGEGRLLGVLVAVGGWQMPHCGAWCGGVWCQQGPQDEGAAQMLCGALLCTCVRRLLGTSVVCAGLGAGFQT
jgi:hypothetical protein